MKNICLITALIIVMGVYSCTKEGRLDHIDEDAPAPAQITNPTVKATEGGAIVKYVLPADANLAYVKAVYEIQPGVFREAKSSGYLDTLTLVGFGDTNKHEVKLYSVGKNEKASEPVTISVTPNTPPVKSIFATVTLESAFGGVSVNFSNLTKANVSIELMVDSTGKNTWAPLNIFYTAAATGKFSARGLKSEEKRFAVFVRDRWNNKSDTLIKKLIPRFEMQIPKTLWKALILNNDIKQLSTAYPLEKAWDGKWAVLTGDSWGTPNGSVMPQWFTIDLGQKVLMSRFKEHQAPTSHLYVASAVKKFELYGSNNPTQDGSWGPWTLLGTFDSFKPSGQPLGTTTAEDKNYGNFLGEDFEFVNQPAAYRYIRWKTLETYSSTGQVIIGEITLFGEVQP